MNSNKHYAYELFQKALLIHGKSRLPDELISGRQLLSLGQASIRELLLWADFTADEPPSEQWLAPLAAMIIAVEDERKSWMLLDDRIGFFLNGIDKIMIGSVNYRLLIICITSLIEYMISSFPFGPIHKDAVDVADALPQIVDRDRLLGVFLKWRDHSLCEESGNAIDRSIDNWVNSASQPRCSASFLSSIIVSWTSSVSRPLLYKRGVFLAAHTDALLLAHHFKLSEKLLVSVYNPEHMQYIRNQFECK